MTIYLIIFILSAGGIIFLTTKQSLKIKAINEEELRAAEQVSNVQFLKSFLEEIFTPVYDFWDTKIIPKIYHKSEKTTHRVRILTLKAERILHKLANYIRGKRELKINGNASVYLQNLNSKVKNG